MARILVLIVLLLSAPTVPATAATQAEILEWLSVHNRYRSLHQAPPLSWSTAVAESARAHAAACPTGHSDSAYGENLAWATGKMTPEDVVALWYSEESDYSYANPGFSSGTGHFTQVVWLGTTEIGCAANSGCNGPYTDVWVCQYAPPGNYLGRFAENVLPPVQQGAKPPAPPSEPPAIGVLLTPLLDLLL